MIIYGVTADDMPADFYMSKRAAIKEARGYTGGEVTMYDIGKLDKAKACRLASGSGFAERSKPIWPKEGEWSR